jgi:hypothetical protein
MQLLAYGSDLVYFFPSFQPPCVHTITTKGRLKLLRLFIRFLSTSCTLSPLCYTIHCKQHMEAAVAGAATPSSGVETPPAKPRSRELWAKVKAYFLSQASMQAIIARQRINNLRAHVLDLVARGVVKICASDNEPDVAPTQYARVHRLVRRHRHGVHFTDREMWNSTRLRRLPNGKRSEMTQ